MQNAIKFGICILALIGLIVLGLFFPAEEKVQEDLFVPGPIPGMLSSFGTPKLNVTLTDVVDLHGISSSREEIRTGKFRYKKDSLPWTFTTPLDWSKPPGDLETRRVLQRLAIMDPFLRSYDQTGNVEDFQQAAFFALDWQSYYQTGRRVTAHAWDEDAALGRVQRLAYLLARIERDPELLNTNGTSALIRLADFHIQRMTDEDYGISQDTILQKKAFLDLCGTLDDLNSCPD